MSLQQLQNSVAETNDFILFFENDVATGIGFTICPNIMLLEQLVLQHFRNVVCLNQWFYITADNNVAKTIGVTTFSTIMLLKLMVVTRGHKLTLLKPSFVQPFQT